MDDPRMTFHDHPTIPNCRVVKFSDEMRKDLTIGDIDFRPEGRRGDTIIDRYRERVAEARRRREATDEWAETRATIRVLGSVLVCMAAIMLWATFTVLVAAR